MAPRCVALSCLAPLLGGAVPITPEISHSTVVVPSTKRSSTADQQKINGIDVGKGLFINLLDTHEVDGYCTYI